ncbi:hypothetical protein ACFQYP_52520 [Nonomuraea antimicrobica]|uniref:hypothetical protein n=1 Tax=Nonomuraea antimicrobica TaxID=561173 RepID=UPI0031E85713
MAKPASLIAATFDDPAEAAAWLTSAYRTVRAAFLHLESVLLEDRLEWAADALPRGVDVQWGEWLQAGRFASIAMICCPNRHVPHPCPTARGTAS